jgi:NADH-quinone oxidoreductase subunit E
MAPRRLAEPHLQPKDFAFTAENRVWAERQLAKYPEGRHWSAAIPLMWRAQEQAGGWLPEVAIRHVADFLRMPHIRALEIATFYTMFNLEPVGRYHVQLCGTTPCMLRGAEDLKRVCHDRIGEQHHVTSDGTFSWVEVECLGACVNAPMVQINADFYEDLERESFTRVLDELAAGGTPRPGPQIDRQFSAPAGGPTTLIGEGLYEKGAGGAGQGGSVTDDQAKRPGEAANVRDAPKPVPPRGDSGAGVDTTRRE